MSILRILFLIYVVGAFGMTSYVTAVYVIARKEGLKNEEALSFSELIVTILAWPWILIMLLID